MPRTKALLRQKRRTQRRSHKSEHESSVPQGQERSTTPVVEGAALRQPANILALQRTLGNQATAKLLRKDESVADRPSVRVRKHAVQPHIQRLNTNEAFYQNTPVNGLTGTNREAGVNFLKLPEMGKFLNAHRIYTEYIQKAKVNNATRPTVWELLLKLNTAAEVLPVIADGYTNEHLKAFDQNVQQKGLDPTSANVFRSRERLEFALSKILHMVRVGVDDIQQEMLALTHQEENPQFGQQRMTWKDVLYLERMGTQLGDLLTEKDLAPGKDGEQSGSPQELSGGVMSTVTALSYRNKDGGSDRRVFKPNEVAPSETGFARLDYFNLQSTNRILASARIDELLLSKRRESDQEAQLLLGKISLGKYNGKFGTVTDFAPGQEGLKTKKIGYKEDFGFLNVDVNDINLHRQMANLQLFDVISGQLDRHPANMKIQQGEGGTKVTGIDNDLGFSEKDEGTETNVQTSGGKTSFPTLVDKLFALAVLSIQDGEFRQTLTGLRQAEIRAAMMRFDSVQSRLREMLEVKQLVALEGQNEENERTWGQITMKDYETETPKRSDDYMVQFTKQRDTALAAMVENPNIIPEKTEEENSKGEKKTEWRIYFKTSEAGKTYLRAMKPDGSDLWELYREARRKAGSTWSSGKGNKVRGGIKLGSRN